MAKKRRTPKKPKDADLFANGNAGPDDANPNGISGVSLHSVAQERYLNYSLSVITSRALPDVRDGLKPVQRRILYTMWQERLTADAKHRKCAGVVGSALRDYHPHGDTALYDALVRLAQPWVMRHPLIDGQGNFGSLDGDNAAAYRYTECRLTPIAATLLDDIHRQTVDFRPNYDGSRTEPVVLPARFPALLVNGSAGIAVGMATSIPPHNLGEVCRALLKVLDNPELKDFQLVGSSAIKGPDFPTGGQIVSSTAELREVYKTGSGAIKLRATTSPGKSSSRSTKTLIIDSIPYAVNKAVLVQRIADIVVGRSMPLITDVRDISTDDVRIELELKGDADEQKVLAYLYKHTPMQVNVQVNLTCLVPTENPEVGRPQRLGLLEVLRYFLIFRHGVITRRLEHELAALLKRLHILEGFQLVFDALDEIIAIIRKSEGKADAAKKIMARFPDDGKGKGLDAEQTDAILELKLYRLARLEINLISDELKEKHKRANQIKKLLRDDEDDMSSGRWSIVRDEINAILKSHAAEPGAKRRTLIDEPGEEVEYNPEDFIVKEDAVVLVTADGYVKRQKDIKDPMQSRVREGDRVLACEAGSTATTIAMFSSLGVCYTARIADLQATTGYGEPIQKRFKLADGERIVAAFSLDPRAVGEIQVEPDSEYAPPTHAFAASSDGNALRFGLEAFVEPSTRSGRRYARLSTGATIVTVHKIHGMETLLCASTKGRGLVCPAEEVNYLSGPGKGVRLMKLDPGDTLLAVKPSSGDRDVLKLETARGGEKTISTGKYQPVSRGGKGYAVLKQGSFARAALDPVTTPVLLDDE